MLTPQNNTNNRTSKIKMLISGITLAWVLIACNNYSTKEIDEMKNNICSKSYRIKELQDSLYKSNKLSQENKNEIEKVEDNLKPYLILGNAKNPQHIKDASDALDSIYNCLLKISDKKQENTKEIEKDTKTKSNRSKKNRAFPLG